MKFRIYTNKRGLGFWFLVFGFWLILFFQTDQTHAQSTNQNAPTPITSNEISGAIRARDLGDARLTSYFYVFDGNQGDVFINIVTKNLNGDIDVFTADNLRPLTKIVVYADSSDNETGRVIYLRKPEKLILRIEGRSPDDNPATFRIKFAGSFAPVAGIAETEESKNPEVRSDEQGEVRVNSVGTIIEVKPKPTPQVKEASPVAEKRESKRETEKVKSDESETVAKKTETTEKEKPTDESRENKKPEVVITDNLPIDEKSDVTAENKTENKTEKKSTDENPNEENKRDEEKTVASEKPLDKPEKPRKTKSRTTAKTETKPKPAPDKLEAVEASQLENIRLIVLFKDGAKIEQPMSDILKVGVDKGILTIIYKNGSIGRYSILEVAKMTIE